MMVHNCEMEGFDGAQCIRAKRPRYSEDEYGTGTFQSFGTIEDQRCQSNSPDPSAGTFSKPALKLPELIELLSKDESVLKWDDSLGVYEVMNGQVFEERFNAMRCTRGKRKEEAIERPFARMHSHFVLVRGGRWAATGTTFRPLVKQQTKTLKSAAQATGSPSSTDAQSPSQGISDGVAGVLSATSSVVPDIAALSAENVKVTLNAKSDSCFHVQCTLQHFLDVTGAGDLYQQAILRSQAAHVDIASASTESEERDGNHWQGLAGIPNPSVITTDIRNFTVPQGILTERDIANIVGTMWDEGSLGDQAYFFFREDGAGPLPNGAIVSLVNGKLRGLTKEACDDPSTLYLVVSDSNAKWKGEPIPTAEEEGRGHWCAFLGQVPIRVDGPVQCGESIGPKPDGSGLGVATSLGRGPIVGIALASKPGDGVAVVKTLCFAGFNALAPLGADFRRLFLRTGALEAQVGGGGAGSRARAASAACVSRRWPPFLARLHNPASLPM